MCGGDPKHFFFYGTLQAECLSKQARQILPKLRRVDEAFASGQLLAIKAAHLIYPALVPDPKADNRVVGICYEMQPDFTAADLGVLDAYEEYFAHRPSKSEYLRQALPVTLKNGARLTAWVYVYNFPLPDSAEPIPSGDFRDYLKARAR